jgi:hypothetical protein
LCPFPTQSSHYESVRFVGDWLQGQHPQQLREGQGLVIDALGDVHDTLHLHRLVEPATFYSTNSVSLTNSALKKEQAKVKSDLLISADGKTCCAHRTGKSLAPHECFGVSMFMPTATGQMAFDYAHERMRNAVPAATCCVTTVSTMRTAGLGAFYDRMIHRVDPQGTRHPACYHISVHPSEVGADVELLKRVAKADGFAMCNVQAAAEPIDLPDSQDLTGDTATLLLECVLQREDLPLSVRFEAAVAQYVLADCTEANVFSAIANDERLAWMLSQHNFGKEKRDVVTDDVIRSIERTFRATLQVTVYQRLLLLPSPPFGLTLQVHVAAYFRAHRPPLGHAQARVWPPLTRARRWLTCVCAGCW